MFVYAEVVDFPFCILEVCWIRHMLRTGSWAARARIGRLSKVATQGRVDDKGMVLEELRRRACGGRPEALWSWPGGRVG